MLISGISSRIDGARAGRRPGQISFSGRPESFRRHIGGFSPGGEFSAAFGRQLSGRRKPSGLTLKKLRAPHEEPPSGGDNPLLVKTPRPRRAPHQHAGSGEPTGHFPASP